MRVWIAAGILAISAGASAQDGAHVTTLASIKGHKAEWAGAFVRVENVTISSFSASKGGLASDATGRARFGSLGMSSQAISRLERYCGGPATGQGRAECRGALEFTLQETGERGFIIGDANFIPEA